MAISDSHAIVIHMTRQQARSGKNAWLVAGPLLVAGVGGISAAVLRVRSGGQSEGAFFGAVIVGGAIVGVVILYALLWYRNVTLYLRGNRLGATNGLGFRREIAADMVEHFRKEYEDPYGTNRPIAVLKVVTRDPKRALRIRGADGLEPGGIERIASAIGVPVEGAW